jgi:regulator of replication initiation timing
MSIELLYIIPIIALVIFAFSLSYIAQKRSAYLEQGKQLSVEVRQFNDGKFLGQEQTTEARLDEFEHTISSINKALSNQQKVIEKFQEENNRYNGEIDVLKKKLRELHKENDIVVSENYSLRAKYNNLAKDVGSEPDRAPGFRFTESEPEPVISKRASQPKGAWEMGMSVLDETKTFSTNVLDDTSVIDISEMFK